MAPAARPLTASEKLDRLRLLRTENVGPITWRRLMARYGSAASALDALPDLARRGGGAKPLRICPLAAAKREMDTLAGLDATMVFLDEADYPPALAAIEDAPPMFCLRGALGLLGKPMVAIVGARNASANGQRLAERLAADLGRSGLVVVSGMARGVDSAAHVGALESGTLAVVAGGVDVVYPPENDGLYRRLITEGAVISETAPGEQPQARHFPRRNRIVSGLSLGVIVVEGAPRSGSLITARLAADQGREVMAVPGSPLDSRAQGPNGLIKNGAALIEDAADVLRILSPLIARPMAEDKPQNYASAPPSPIADSTIDAARPRVIEALGMSPVGVDEVIRLCTLPPAVVAVVLLELELAGRLDRLVGNRVCLIA
ncbi:SMF protein [Rhodospirillum rubrum F11]|uniref:SMF protein n=1 Tax=Rhodospirillum rubrum (strain ATCC 11170 / ATH 1.1.1 / DSM 467 / LMG 4362 / NCIMB 8255 / S1) TaxID=269796 RepID=Q2RPF6_RHORT|nr:DNA-processing protein DprA [Rhodospirillum rubrum]ABC23989.1 SMF protein [Rhodospirillum rubrum ATCC 11170]AEO49734.1 SMF protein [Rhodospirillum rubrum F11]MBK5955673.1 DNA-processing protein DprA [Rhodospirillum rubrum]QXG79931.1 DNA-processing protein DprA [Rhodospirillum rubrum]HCF19539.1 DNA-protecting protein DprA [Rhodospirillum rubrum]